MSRDRTADHRSVGSGDGLLDGWPALYRLVQRLG